MYKKWITMFAIALLAAVPMATAEHHEMSEEQQAAMEAWQKAMTPGEPHAELAKMVGTWKAVNKMWMGPGEPQVSEATVEREMVLGGRVLKESYSSEFQGMPFEGIGLTGFDNVTGKYWSTWMDNASTGLYRSHGSWDEESGALVYRGKMSDPMSGEIKKTKSVMRKVSDDETVFEMFEMHDDTEQKTMEIVYTRQ